MFVVVRRTYTTSGEMNDTHRKYGKTNFPKGIRTEFDDLDSANEYYDNEVKYMGNRSPEYFTELYIEEIVNGRTQRQLRYRCFGR